MNLSQFFKYKNTLMQDLLKTPEIVNLIDGDIDLKDAHKLAYTKVFPYEYIPETVEDGKVIICFDVDISSSMHDSTYCAANLFIWVFVHKSLLRLGEGGIRPDKICHEIDVKINGSRFYGLGELDLKSVRRFAPMTDYIGKVMTYVADDFNRKPSYTRKNSVPSNRLEGK